MKRLVILLLLACLLFTAGCAEEAFFEEESFTAGSFSQEESFFEESFDGTFIDSLEEPAAAPEKAVTGEVEEEEAIESRSVFTLDFDDVQTPTEEEWWWTQPVLYAEAQKEDGVVKLTWAQPVKFAKLPTGVMYYVYAVDPLTGIARQVKTIGAKKITIPDWVASGMRVMTPEDPNHSVELTGSFTGPGNTVTLKKQKKGTQYFVRAEKQTKNKGQIAPSETYGYNSGRGLLPYEKVTFEGIDESWKSIREVELWLADSEFVYLTWFADRNFSHYGSYSNFKVLCESWDQKGRLTKDQIDLSAVSDSENVDEEYYVPYKMESEYQHCLHMRIPAGAAKLRFTVTAVRDDGEKAKTASQKSPTLTFPADGWKKVFNFSVKASIDDWDKVYLDWDVIGGAADRYVLSGLADKAEIVWDYALNRFVCASPAVKALKYEMSWAAGGKTYFLRWGWGSSCCWINGVQTYEPFPDLSSILTSKVEGKFQIEATINEPKNLVASITLTPYRGKKAGEKAKDSAVVESSWKLAPEITWADGGEYWSDANYRIIHLDWYTPNVFEGMQYVIKGLGKPITVTVHMTTDTWGYEVPGSVDVDNPNDPTYLPGSADSRGISIPLRLKPGKKNVTIQAVFDDSGYILKGLVGKVKIDVPKKTKKSGAVIESVGMAEGDLMVSFRDMNLRSDSFCVTVTEQPGRLVVAGNQHCNSVEFKKSKLFDNPGSYQELTASGGGKVHAIYDLDDDVYYLYFTFSKGNWFSAMVETILDDGSRVVDAQSGILADEYIGGL